MIKFDGKIVQFGFGAVGKSFFEKVSKEIKYDEQKYFIITRNKFEFEAFVNMGGLIRNFIVADVNKENFKEVFGKYLNEGDLLIDFADTVGTKDFVMWCAQNNIMYINTGEADWSDNWYSIFEENLKKDKLKKSYKYIKNICKYPIVLQHGNNPGLVSHFVKAGLEYIIEKQYKKNKKLKEWLKNNQFNEIARYLKLRMIHVNDVDLQKITENFDDEKLYSTWCIDSFFFEMLSEATIDIGTHENIDYEQSCNLVDYENGFVELKQLAIEKQCKTMYPYGRFDGFLVPHEETITIAKGLEIEEEGKVVYRPSVMFIYSPCDLAKNYFEKAKVGIYEKNNSEVLNNNVVRGYTYPKKAEIVYSEKINEGTEYVGVLLIGEDFKPVWVGNRIEKNFLYKTKKDSYWQTPTITPVAMSALSAVCWMLKNQDRGEILFPDDIEDYKEIIKKAEKYISKTIYKTIEKEELEKNLNINFSDIKAKDFFI